ncbi:MAG: acyl carrier protein [Pelagibacterales bacterium]|jgi:acyl carrier protein|nr:acyl carrier protein [Pelagibacterales bacterium]
MKKNKNKAIFRLVAKLLEVNENKININTSVKSLDEYDSLAILNIMTHFEKKYKIKQKNLNLKEFESVKGLIKILNRNNINLK